MLAKYVVDCTAFHFVGVAFSHVTVCIHVNKHTHIVSTAFTRKQLCIHVYFNFIAVADFAQKVLCLFFHTEFIVVCSVSAIPDKGEVLTIYNIKKYCDDVYTCTAFNDVGTADHQSIRVRVRCMYQLSYHYIIIHRHDNKCLGAGHNICWKKRNHCRISIFSLV